ncbi:protein phosphatase 2C domain-containing protein [Sphaerisporangium sp. NPDC051011]|uniref:protein phosphatase 2C domain-containing protein n=1 Tax=Sphaerisporangium sp. NPDC051011 TaxID=3155792 RepID=UPI003406BCF4
MDIFSTIVTILLLASLVACGVLWRRERELLARLALLPATVAPRIQYVDRPIEVVKHVDRPVEVVTYVDRPVEVVTYVDRPVEVVKHVDRPVEVVTYVEHEEPETPPGAEHLADPEALPDVPDTVPDSVVDGARFGRLTVRAASVRGEPARQNAQLRKQTVSLAVLELFDPPVLLSAVAAGRPSSRRSQIGAAQVCRSVQHRLSEAAPDLDAAWRAAVAGDPAASGLLDRLLGDVVLRLVDPLTEAARWRALGPEDVATDLTCLLTRLGDGPQREHLVFGVGAGSVTVLRTDGPAQAYDPEEGGPERSKELLPTSPGAVRWERFSTTAGEVTVACTASTTRLLSGPRFADRIAAEWLDGPPALIRFLGHLALPEPQSRGDRTAIVLWEKKAGREDG